ncbi:MAG: DUF6390 family protein [Candidatus Diapherotrites archaeon]
MNPPQKAARYSYQPNKLNYCGPENAHEKLLNFVNNPVQEEEAEIVSLLKQFSALHPYLELIAQKNEIENEFDEKVINAYWTGNELLEHEWGEDLRELLREKLTGPHLLPQKISEKLAAELPNGLLPHHSFNVLYVNFVTKKVSPIVQNLSNCLVKWGKVVDENELKAKTVKLISENNEFKLKEEIRKFENPFGIPLQKNDLISLHWGIAVEKIPETELKNLKKATQINLEAVNSQGR